MEGLRDNGFGEAPSFLEREPHFLVFVPGPLTPLPCPCPMWLTPTEPSYPLKHLIHSLCLRLYCSYHALLHFPSKWHHWLPAFCLISHLGLYVHHQNLTTNISLPKLPCISLFDGGCIFSGHSKYLWMLREHLGPNPQHYPYSLLILHTSQAYLERWRKRRQKRRVKPKNLGIFLDQESGLLWINRGCVWKCSVQFKTTRATEAKVTLAGTLTWLPERTASTFSLQILSLFVCHEYKSLLPSYSI